MPDPLLSTMSTIRGYRASIGVRWPLLVIVLTIHGAGFLLFNYLGALPMPRKHERRLMVNLVDLAPPPVEKTPPVADLPVTPIAVPRPPVPAKAVAPPPIVQPSRPAPPPIETVAAPAAVPAEPPAPMPPAVKRVEPVADLTARLLAARPPRYPVESRRRHETGVVVLMVDVGDDGRVSSIAVAQSSGHDRLDEAALRAVREWRWSPTLVEGHAAPVRGLVRIPFVLAL